MSLKELIHLSEKKGSRLILALDNLKGKCKDEIVTHAKSLLSSLSDYVVGVKIGYPLTLSVGLEEITEIIQNYERDYYFIADFKLADIPYIVKLITEKLLDIGFNAVIAHLFTMSLNEVVEMTHEREIGIIGVLMMSHPKATLFEKNFKELLNYAKEVHVDGVVIGATRPRYIVLSRKLLHPNQVIFSPGIITQGGRVGEALELGADFEIVGRAITMSSDPVNVACSIVENERRVIYGTR